ncbi:MAG: sigma-70 family RNA polymerase sigma factor [Clostridia bacterium]|nr:sigma-70 family RNA polymerase sigma factor [Clostridia bacterium]
MDRNTMLIGLAQQGDDEATEILCRENMRLVQSIAARFSDRGHELCDLVQIASIGLLKAISGFDLTRGLKFSTYAVPVITGEIKRFLRDDGIIKVSRGLKERKILAKRAEEELRRQLGREPTVSEVAQKCSITVGELTEAYEACSPIESIDAPCETGTDLSERIGVSQEEQIVDKLTAVELLSRLPNRERQVIIMRYFEDRTQSDTARVIGVSQVHVSRLERSALEKLRAMAVQ